MSPCRHPLVLLLAIVVLAVLAFGPAWGEAESSPDLFQDTAPGLAYQAHLIIPEDLPLKQRLEDSSRLVALQDTPPASALGLRRRVAEDVERLRALLQAEGYYGATVAEALDLATVPAQVRVSITPGPVYRLDRFTFDPPWPRPEAPPSFADLGLSADQPAEAQSILDAVERAALILRNSGHPFARVERHRAVVDHARRTMAVTLALEAGPAAPFGPTRFDGLESVEDSHVRQYLTWREGQPYDRRLIQSLRRALLATGLFDSVEVIEGEALDAMGRLPMTVRLSEAKHRTLGAGLRYSSSQGAGARAYWEHRNLFGAGERLRTDLSLAEQGNSLGATLRKPNMWRTRQDLVGSFQIATERLDAYDRESVEAFLGLERPVGDYWRVGAGVSWDFASLTDQETGEQRSTLIGFPLTAQRDSTDNRLDPSEGSRLAFAVTPYGGTLGGDSALFLKTEATGSLYIPLTASGWTVAAVRGRVGMIHGAERTDIPADKRFYAGGGGSLRGFGHQMAGDLSATGDPIGGKAVMEVGAELRLRLTETLGIVPFVEAGRAVTQDHPGQNRRLFLAAGLGARYHTPVGPLRLDVALPLNRRVGVDRSWQVYISLGQAF